MYWKKKHIYWVNIRRKKKYESYAHTLLCIQYISDARHCHAIHDSISNWIKNPYQPTDDIGIEMVMTWNDI